MPILTSEFEQNGNAFLEIRWDGKQPDRYPLSLTIGKAKKAIEAMNQIKTFVEKHKNDPRKAKPVQENHV